jgi:cobalt/nickel transport system ATP-binding protein
VRSGFEEPNLPGQVWASACPSGPIVFRDETGALPGAFLRYRVPPRGWVGDGEVGPPAFQSRPIRRFPGDSESLLAADGLSYAYLERFPALEDVSLQVARGERLALLGANGCGKSTLLKVLAGVVFPDRGSYFAFGEEVTERKLEDEQFSRGFRARVGIVFQNADAQVFSPTVREEIAFGPLQLGLDREEVEARTGDVARMLEIDALADRAPYQLSAGQKKRVAIASVLVMNPELLLLDEPTAGLDPRSRQWLIELVAELGAAGKTIVLATHELAELERVCDRCLVLSQDHRLVAEGTPGEILADRDLLARVNLVHEHPHRHGTLFHSHVHERGHHH